MGQKTLQKLSHSFQRCPIFSNIVPFFPTPAKISFEKNILLSGKTLDKTKSALAQRHAVCRLGPGVGMTMD